VAVGIVVVSHSRALADAVVALATEMVHGREVSIEVAAGLDDGSFGTDAIAIGDAVVRADNGDGVVVLMDLGSAVLSAELALELMDDDSRERVVLCPAPLVEGLIVAAVTADSGADVEAVAREATAALQAKQAQLGTPEPSGSPEFAESAGVGSGDAETAVFTVTPAHGLHARPSALVVQAVRGLDAMVTLRNLTRDTGPVPAASLSRVATLGALRDHRVEVRATGPDARAAVRALVDLAMSGFGEEAQGPPTPPPAREPPRSDQPRPASPGIGIGPARRPTTTTVTLPPEVPGTPDRQRARLDDAVRQVRGDLESARAHTARRIGAGEAAIFEAQVLLLDDPDLLTEARHRIDTGADAARAWAGAADEVERRFAEMDDEYLRARAGDVRDVRDQVLRRLGGTSADSGDAGDSGGVLVATDLTPAEAAALDPTSTVAVVLAHGSPTAHSAILLRGLGIPAVVGAQSVVDRVTPGTVLAVDGTTGELAVHPDESVLARYRARAQRLARHTARALEHAHEPAVTADGTTILVGANVGSAQDAAAAVGADLAGLVRTEFCFLDRAEPPTVAEQETAYRGIAEALPGRRITLRTLDVGGDKPLDYLPTAHEANPFLGVRGIRLALRRPELLTDQLEAIVRVAHDHPVDIMFPMISTVAELLAAREALTSAIETVGRGEPPGLRVGIMVEVPAAALKAAAFGPHVDFLSIGTNDLTQYALAAERGNDDLAELADALDPGVLALIDSAGRIASEDVLVAVCGELAGDEEATALLLGMGVRELSVAPASVARVKEAVRQVTIADARELAARALSAPDAATVRRLVAGLVHRG
jgi:phosphocarrier protein FPr